MKKILFFAIIIVACIAFEYNKPQAIPTIKISSKIKTEELANKLIKDIFNSDDKFKTEAGNGKNYIKRYYCSNVLIDVCSDGSIRYLSNIFPASEEDIFTNWLFKNEEMKILEYEKSNEVINCKFIGKNISGNASIDTKTRRIIAAKFKLN